MVRGSGVSLAITNKCHSRENGNPVKNNMNFSKKKNMNIIKKQLPYLILAIVAVGFLFYWYEKNLARSVGACGGGDVGGTGSGIGGDQ